MLWLFKLLCAIQLLDAKRLFLLSRSAWRTIFLFQSKNIAKHNISFDSASRFARSWGKPKNQCDIIPQRFLTTIAKDLNGYYGSSYKEGACGGNPSQGQSTSNRHVEAIHLLCPDIWYSFKIKQIDTSKMPYSFEYRWQQITTLVRYNEAGKGISIFCLGCPPDIEKLVQEKLASHSISDPIEWHIILIEAIVELYDKSVWALRDYVRDAEFVSDLLAVSVAITETLSGTRLIRFLSTELCSSP